MEFRALANIDETPAFAVQRPGKRVENARRFCQS